MPLTENNLTECGKKHGSEKLMELRQLIQLIDASPVSEREEREKAATEKAMSFGLSASARELMEADYNGILDSAIDFVSAQEEDAEG